MIGYWKLNDGGYASQVIDYSTSNINGNINNASWYSPDSLWMYNYSNTPRIADVPVTALSHLCVPIDSNWQLDGVSLIPNCTGTALEEINKAPRGLVKITDIIGRITEATNNNLLFYIYDDGSVEKKIIIN